MHDTEALGSSARSQRGPRVRLMTVGAIAVLAVGILVLTIKAGRTPSVALVFHQDPPGTPVLSSGTEDAPLFVMDPCVLKDGEGYHIFFSSFFVKRAGGLSLFRARDASKDPDAYTLPKLTTAIAYGFSADRGLHWQVRPAPVLAPAEGHAWDGNRVETASAIVSDGILYVFYCADGDYEGKEFTARYQIGLASLDLVGGSLRENLLEQSKTLARSSDKPFVPFVTDRVSFLNNVQEPSIVRDGDNYELYFVGLRLRNPGVSIGEPGQHITQVGAGRAVLNGKLEIQEVSQKPLVSGANIIEVERVNGRYLLFSVTGGGEAHKGEYLQYYTSEDGLHWSRPAAILQNIPRSAFESWGITSPTVVEEGNRLVLFYTGLEAGQGADQTRWGIQMNPEQRLFATLGRAVSSELPLPGEP